VRFTNTCHQWRDSPWLLASGGNPRVQWYRHETSCSPCGVARRRFQLKPGEHHDPTAVRPRERRALTIQSNRLNVITKKVTGWAAIIVIPTLITGFFGMNVPYPGFGERAGLAASVAAIVLAGLVLYLVFKRKDWL
jgi:hypothetical protein